MKNSLIAWLASASVCLAQAISIGPFATEDWVEEKIDAVVSNVVTVDRLDAAVSDVIDRIPDVSPFVTEEVTNGLASVEWVNSITDDLISEEELNNLKLDWSSVTNKPAFITEEDVTSSVSNIVPSWALDPTPPSGTDGGAVTSIVESIVPAWSRETDKPEYGWQEITDRPAIINGTDVTNMLPRWVVVPIPPVTVELDPVFTNWLATTNAVIGRVASTNEHFITVGPDEFKIEDFSGGGIATETDPVFTNWLATTNVVISKDGQITVDGTQYGIGSFLKWSEAEEGPGDPAFTYYDALVFRPRQMPTVSYSSAYGLYLHCHYHDSTRGEWDSRDINLDLIPWVHSEGGYDYLGGGGIADPYNLSAITNQLANLDGAAVFEYDSQGGYYYISDPGSNPYRLDRMVYSVANEWSTCIYVPGSVSGYYYIDRFITGGDDWPGNYFTIGETTFFPDQNVQYVEREDGWYFTLGRFDTDSPSIGLDSDWTNNVVYVYPALALTNKIPNYGRTDSYFAEFEYTDGNIISNPVTGCRFDMDRALFGSSYGDYTNQMQSLWLDPWYYDGRHMLFRFEHDGMYMSNVVFSPGGITQRWLDEDVVLNWQTNGVLKAGTVATMEDLSGFIASETDPQFTSWLGTNALVAGEGAMAGGSASTAIGANAKTYNYCTAAVGNDVVASNIFSAAFGVYDTKALGSYSIAVGSYAQASGMSSVAVGSSVFANGDDSVALGTSTHASGNGAVAIGRQAVVNVSSNLPGRSTIQLGKGSNFNYGTFKVGDYELLDINGFVPRSLISADANTKFSIGNGGATIYETKYGNISVTFPAGFSIVDSYDTRYTAPAGGETIEFFGPISSTASPGYSFWVPNAFVGVTDFDPATAGTWCLYSSSGGNIPERLMFEIGPGYGIGQWESASPGLNLIDGNETGTSPTAHRTSSVETKQVLYSSNGSVRIDPQGGPAGFWIGETNLQSLLTPVRVVDTNMAPILLITKEQQAAITATFKNTVGDNVSFVYNGSISVPPGYRGYSIRLGSTDMGNCWLDSSGYLTISAAVQELVTILGYDPIAYFPYYYEYNGVKLAPFDEVRDMAKQVVAENTVLLESIAPVFSASNAYTNGDFVVRDAKLYECTNAVTAGDPWYGGDWRQTSVSEVLGNIRRVLDLLNGEAL